MTDGELGHALWLVVGAVVGVPFEMTQLILKRVAAGTRTSGKTTTRNVLADNAVVGRIFDAAASPVGTPWMWTLAFGHHEDRTPTHGYAATREAAMAPWRSHGGGRSNGKDLGLGGK